MSKDDEARRKKRNAFIIGGIFIFIMLLSTLGYAFMSGGGSDIGTTSTTEVKVNGFEFKYTNGYWASNINGVNYIFRFNPKQTQNLEYEKGVLNPIGNFNNKPLYYSVEDDYAFIDIATNLNPAVERLQEACLDEKDCSEEMIAKTCSDNFIIIRKSETNSIRQDQNCVYIEGKESDLSMLADEYLFNILGVK